MKLYAIQRQMDKRYLKGLGTTQDGEPYWIWGKTPHFWSTIDGVTIAAKKVGCRVVNNDKFRFDEDGNKLDWRGYKAAVEAEGVREWIKGNSVIWSYFDYDERKIADLKIIELDVTVNGSTQIDPRPLIADERKAA